MLRASPGKALSPPHTDLLRKDASAAGRAEVMPLQCGVMAYPRVVRVNPESSIKLREWSILPDSSLSEASHDLRPTRREASPASFLETAEQIEVSKQSWVIEEVEFSKSFSQRTQHLVDTLQRTEVEVQILPPDEQSASNHDAILSRS